MVNRKKNKVNEKVCAITGGSSGFGKILAGRFMSLGYKVAVCSRTAENKCKENFLSVKADVENLKDMEKFFKEIIEKWTALDAVIVNAGINIDGLLVNITQNDIDRILKTNLKGFFNTVKPVLSFFKQNNRGHIISVSSFSGSFGSYGQSVYSATKAGLIGAVKSVAKEAGQYGICVNAVMPGFLDVGMGKRAGLKVKERAINSNVLRRLACPYESAEFITHLSGMTGVSAQVFNLDSRVLNWI